MCSPHRSGVGRRSRRCHSSTTPCRPLLPCRASAPTRRQHVVPVASSGAGAMVPPSPSSTAHLNGGVDAPSGDTSTSAGDSHLVPVPDPRESSPGAGTTLPRPSSAVHERGTGSRHNAQPPSAALARCAVEPASRGGLREIQQQTVKAAVARDRGRLVPAHLIRLRARLPGRWRFRYELLLH